MVPILWIYSCNFMHGVNFQAVNTTDVAAMAKIECNVIGLKLFKV